MSKIIREPLLRWRVDIPQEGDCLDYLFALRWPDGFCLSPIAPTVELGDNIAGTLALFWMSQASFRSSWNGSPRHTSGIENLVSSDVVYHQSEKWGERSGAAKSSRPWQLPDGLVNVAQTSAGPW